MDSYLHQLTAVILTYKTNLEILKKCLKSIDPKVKILIVENSSEFKYLKEINNNFSNVEVICSGSNLGYGGGNNFGLNKVKTNYALILNPDVVCEDNFFNNINKYLSGEVDFALMGADYNNNTDFKPAGFFNDRNLESAKFDKNFNLYEVDWIAGHTILINMKKFINKIFFDENFFLFFEEFDLCMSLKRKNEKIFISKDLKVDHMGWKSSFNIEGNLELYSHKLRNWHYMWSFFYFNKKNHGYLYSFFKSLSRLIRSIFRIIFYSITFNKTQRIIYTFRFLGLINSICLKKSSYRVNIKD